MGLPQTITVFFLGHPIRLNIKTGPFPHGPASGPHLEYKVIMLHPNTLATSNFRAELVLNVAVILAVLGISMQLFDITYPPMVDLPNHLARHAIQCGTSYGSNYASYYDFELRAVPNLFADLVYWFDAACSDIFLTNRILIQVMILNLVISVYVLHFALWRRISVWPAASALLVYNTSFTYGFENYVLAAPIAIYLFALWVILSNRNFLQLAIMVPLSFGLYFLHIIVFGFFVLLVAGWEVNRAIKMSVGLRGFILRLSGASLLFLPAMIHFIILNTNSPMGDSVNRFSLLARIDALFSLTMPRIRSLLGLSDMVIPLLVFIGLAVLVYVGVRKRKLQVFEGMRWGLGILLLVAVLAPATLANVAFVHIRYPYLVAVVLIAATQWRISLSRQAALASVIIVVFAGYTYDVRKGWLSHDAEVRELLVAAQALPEDAWVFPARSEMSDVVIRHSHSQSYIGLYYPIFVPSLFNGANPLTPKPAVKNFVATQMFPWHVSQLLASVQDYTPQGMLPDSKPEKWQGWQDRFTHYLVFGDTPVDPSALPEEVTVLLTGSFFTILQNNRVLEGR